MLPQSHIRAFIELRCFAYASVMPLAPQQLRTYFLTFVAAHRRRLFQVEANAELFIDVLRIHRAKARFEMYAFAVMPDHAHLLLTPAADVSLEKTVQYIKGGFSFLLKSKLDVWERGYNESRVADVPSFHACQRYIEQNPVRKHLAATATVYPFSSASRIDLIDPPPQWLRAREPRAKARSVRASVSGLKATAPPMRGRCRASFKP